MTDVKAFLGAVGPHLEIMRFMKPDGLAAFPDDGSCAHPDLLCSRAGQMHVHCIDCLLSLSTALVRR